MRLTDTALAACLSLTLCAGCSGIEHAPAVKASCADKWVVLPMENLTEGPHVAQAAEKLAENVLRSQGMSDVASYPSGLADSLAEFGSAPQKYAKALEWARGEEAHYGITGAVTEWRYKSGVEGEPVVGMTLQVIDIETGKGIGSAGGSKTGWDREAVTGVAQKLIRKLLGATLPGC